MEIEKSARVGKSFPLRNKTKKRKKFQSFYPNKFLSLSFNSLRWRIEYEENSNKSNNKDCVEARKAKR